MLAKAHMSPHSRFTIVERDGVLVKIGVFAFENDAAFAAEFSASEAEEIAVNILRAVQDAKNAEIAREMLEEDQLLERAKEIWRRRYGDKPFLQAVAS